MLSCASRVCNAPVSLLSFFALNFGFLLICFAKLFDSQSLSVIFFFLEMDIMVIAR